MIRYIIMDNRLNIKVSNKPCLAFQIYLEVCILMSYGWFCQIWLKPEISSIRKRVDVCQVLMVYSVACVTLVFCLTLNSNFFMLVWGMNGLAVGRIGLLKYFWVVGWVAGLDYNQLSPHFGLGLRPSMNKQRWKCHFIHKFYSFLKLS